jgi:hypothetical protein
MTPARPWRASGYESMSDVNTGTGPFPTAAQVAGGGYWEKSARPAPRRAIGSSWG